MPGGRPRTVSPPPEELEALGVEMVEWIKNTPNVLHVSYWYSLEKFFTDNAWETMVKRPEFVGYYEQAKKLIGKQYLDKTSNVREGISQRWQRVYFRDLRDQEDQDSEEELQRQLRKIEQEARIKNDQQEKVADNIVEQFDATLNQLKSLRPSKALKSSDNSKSSDK